MGELTQTLILPQFLNPLTFIKKVVDSIKSTYMLIIPSKYLTACPDTSTLSCSIVHFNIPPLSDA